MVIAINIAPTAPKQELIFTFENMSTQNRTKKGWHWDSTNSETIARGIPLPPKRVSETTKNMPYPIGSMVLLYMVTFTINIPPMLAYIPAPWFLCHMAGCCHSMTILYHPIHRFILCFLLKCLNYQLIYSISIAVFRSSKGPRIHQGRAPEVEVGHSGDGVQGGWHKAERDVFVNTFHHFIDSWFIYVMELDFKLFVFIYIYWFISLIYVMEIWCSTYFMIYFK